MIMIPVEEVKKFKPKISGRPRKNTPLWRTTPKDNKQLTTFIRVSTHLGQEQQLQQTLDKIKRVQAHLFRERLRA
ncbi:MAG TPA: hypothetical protein DHW02_10650 [Ktedonobacter sp.]|nr:hypothetical protein [Ktedonobacter sp.]